MEGCQIWANAQDGVIIQNPGSEAVVAGCKCAGGRVPVARGVVFLGARVFFFFYFSGSLPAMLLLLLTPLLNVEGGKEGEFSWRLGVFLIL